CVIEVFLKFAEPCPVRPNHRSRTRPHPRLLRLRSLHYRRTACGDRFQLSYESAKAYLMPVANDINARQSTALHDVVAVAELALSRRAGSAHPAGTICENAADAYPVVGELLEKLHEPR